MEVKECRKRVHFGNQITGGGGGTTRRGGGGGGGGGGVGGVGGVGGGSKSEHGVRRLFLKKKLRLTPKLKCRRRGGNISDVAILRSNSRFRNTAFQVF